MASPKRVLPTAALLLLLSGLTPIFAADTFTIVPTAPSADFPACGLGCPILTQAQDACVPQAPVTDDKTYVQCFCSSAMLTGLTTSGAVCYTCTDGDDQNKLVSWYKNYCNGGYTSTMSAPTATATVSTVGSASTSTGSATTTATSTSVPTSTPDDSEGQSSTLSANGQSGKSWISTHWQWIVMVVVLIIGFTALAFGGMWLKKRIDARHPGLYHGDDREHSSSNNNSARFRSPVAGFAIPTSLRNFSARNSRSNTPNNGSQTRNIDYHSVPAQPPVAPYASSHHGSSTSNPNMSMTSLSGSNNHHLAAAADMWTPPHPAGHARSYNEITPADESPYAGHNGSDMSSIDRRRSGNEPVSPVSPIH